MDLLKKYNAGLRYHAPREFPEYPSDHKFKVLSWTDWKFWRKNGYLVIPNIIPLKNCENLIDKLWKYIGADPVQNETWYDIPARSDDLKTRKSIAGMVELYHHPFMWDNRESKKIYNLFVDLWSNEKLWVSIDRVNVNIPVRKDWDFKGFLHWDIDVTYDPMPKNIQGVLSLNNTSDGSGGLQIIPDLFLQLEDWLKKLPKGWNESSDGRHHYSNYFNEFDVLNVESKTGDLIIWDSRMAHGTSPNFSNFPRFAQYISMVPAEPEQEELLRLRIDCFNNQSGPEGCGMPGDPKELTFSSKYKLTNHGGKILGAIPWS